MADLQEQGVELLVEAYTHQGTRKYQEDRYLLSPENGMFLVVDGMGGHPNGDKAAETVVKCFKEINLTGDISKDLHDCAVRANTICLNARDFRGAVASGVIIVGEELVIFGIGDASIFINKRAIPALPLQELAGGALAACIGCDRDVPLQMKRVPIKDVEYLLLATDGIEYLGRFGVEEFVVANKSAQEVDKSKHSFNDNITLISMHFKRNP